MIETAELAFIVCPKNKATKWDKTHRYTFFPIDLCKEWQFTFTAGGSEGKLLRQKWVHTK